MNEVRRESLQEGASICKGEPQATHVPPQAKFIGGISGGTNILSKIKFLINQ